MTTRTTTTEGWLYLVVNDRFPGWIKVGRTADTKRRLSSYQMYDPFRSYRMLHQEPVAHQRMAEWLLKERLDRLGFERSGEWFRVGLSVARREVRRAALQAVQFHPVPAATSQEHDADADSRRRGRRLPP